MMRIFSHKILLISFFVIVVFLIMLLIPTSKKPTKTESEKIKITLPADAIDPEKLWRSYFEDKLLENRDLSNSQISGLKDVYREDFEKLQAENRNNLENLRSDFNNAHLNLKSKIHEIIELHRKDMEEKHDEIYQPNISLLNISDNSGIYNMPFDRKSYIAETSYVSGILMGGIAVSTSIGSASAPVPVVMRVVDKGNFPPNFKLDLKQCRILGSAYGDLSSERAVIRAEMLVCENKDEITSTRISGIIYGDDGMNGIKGRVIDMSSKHIRNAALGSMIGAFGNTMKSEADLAITPFGAISQKRKNTYENFKDNSLKGAGNAAEKIADYYIKQAENMSPILQIPGGTKVDVVFTKGVYLGSKDLLQKIDLEKR